MPIRYKPDPGSTESRVVELLRFLPAGTALHVRESVELAFLEEPQAGMESAIRRARMQLRYSA